MGSSFIHTLRSIDRREPWGVWLLPALALTGAWTVWMTQARVTVYVTAARARIEVSRMTHRVAAQEGGRIVRLSVELGKSVRAGERLAELDTSVERAVLAREQNELAGLAARITALDEHIERERAKRASRAQVHVLATRKARSELEQLRLRASHQAELTSIANELHRRSLTARMESVSAEVELRGSRLRVGEAELEIEVAGAQRDYDDKAALAALAQLQSQRAELEAERGRKQAEIATALAQIERRTIAAPVSGRLGNITALQVGDVVKPGDVIATIVPSDDVRVVAEFVPDEAVGRIVSGCAARVTLHGFSWVEYGSLPATVAQPASEPHGGTIRVELSLAAAGRAHAWLQHGLPASVEVAVERVSPWALVLRAVGSSLREPALRQPSAAGLAGDGESR